MASVADNRISTSIRTLFDQCDPSARALFHHPSMGVITMDVSGRYEVVNPAAARLLRTTVEHLIGRYHHEVFTEDSHQDAFREVINRTWVCYSHTRADGPCDAGDYWDISISLRRRGDGLPNGYLLLIQEVSSFKHALQEADRQRQLFCALLDEVPAGIIIAQGSSGIVTMINTPARRVYGDVLSIGSSLLQIRSLDYASQSSQYPADPHPLLTTLLTGKRMEEVTLPVISPDGRELTLRMDCAPLGVWDGEPAAIAVFHDITGHARYERELERQNIRLQELDHAKDTFLANVSHELKTPLTAILGWVSTARELNDTLLTGQALEVIERNAQRQAWMIDDLLTLSNCLAGRLVLHHEKVCIHDVCREAMTRAYMAMKHPETAMHLCVPEMMVCIADPLRLRQLLENLLTNALKFTPHYGEISVNARDEGTRIAIEIHDTGIGIEEKHIGSVFRPFWQADCSASRKYSGSGIGLTVVKELVALHGGEVTVYSAGLGKGTSFTIRLPKHGPHGK